MFQSEIQQLEKQQEQWLRQQIGDVTTAHPFDNHEEAEEFSDEQMEAAVALSIEPKVKEWLDIHSEIEILQKAIKERKEKKKKLDLLIMNFMKSHEIPHFDLKQNKLILNVAQKQMPLNQKWIEDVITKNCSKDQMELLKSQLFKSRPMVEKTTLKYKKPRKVALKSNIV